MLYQSLYIMIWFCKSYLHIMSFYVVTTLSIIAVTFSHVTTCFWQIFATESDMICVSPAFQVECFYRAIWTQVVADRGRKHMAASFKKANATSPWGNKLWKLSQQFRYRSLCTGQCMGIFPEGATVDFYGFLWKAGVGQVTVRTCKIRWPKTVNLLPLERGLCWIMHNMNINLIDDDLNHGFDAPESLVLGRNPRVFRWYGHLTQC